MDAFSLLKYWKSGGVHGGCSGGATSNLGASSGVSPTTTTTIVTAVGDENEDESSDVGNDDGPFFDLEFAVPANDEEEERENVNEIEIDEEEMDQNLSFSPSDDLFFKGKVVPPAENDGGVIKSGQFQVPASLVKSATKLRVFMLNLKRSKSESKQNNNEIVTTTTSNNNNKNNKRNNKFFTVKLRLEDVKGLHLRASSNSKLNNNNASLVQEQQEEEKDKTEENCSGNCENERKNKKEMVQKYLKMVKPLYLKVSKSNTNSEAEEVKKEITVVKNEEKVRVGGVKIKQGLNLKGIAKKHLGKSKSAVVHSMPNIHNHINTTSSKKRDDSLLQQQDGIQSAILHCKRSFNSSSDDGEETTSVLTRSASDPSHEKKSTVTSAGVAELMRMMEKEE